MSNFYYFSIGYIAFWFIPFVLVLFWVMKLQSLERSLDKMRKDFEESRSS